MVKKLFIIIAFLVLIFSAVHYGYAAENKVYIGILPYYAPDKIWHFYEPFIDYLNKTTDISWELKLYHNYDAIIDGICSSEVSIAYLGPNPFGLAYEKCKAKPLLVILGDDGKPFYRSIIFTNNHKINSLKELKGKPFAFGDRDSTSSNIVPRKMLEDAGITMDMIKPVFLKSHEKIINAVVFEKFKGLKFKVLKVSEPLPLHSFCTTSNINPDIERKFMNALLKLKPLHDDSDRNIVKNWDPELRYGFTLPPKDYIQNILKLHRLFEKYND
jgi:phosphonate transport system substrate-binding protein